MFLNSNQKVEILFPQKNEFTCQHSNCHFLLPMIQFVLMFNKLGKVRIAKWYSSIQQKERQSIIKEVTRLVLRRDSQCCHFVEWKDIKLVYTRYASLYFLFAADQSNNEIFVLDTIHFFVEAMDQFFGDACEIDVIYNFYYVYMLLDEIILGGEVFETNTKNAIDSIVNQHHFIEDTEGENSCEL